ncbi:MAG: copper chaperone PCu(A)C [Proteobacteria bacterium]|nr:copper chaperone PCu(A)C [Pseudomonadota bacterium]
MNHSHLTHLALRLLAGSSLLAAGAASAHVTLAEGSAAAGSDYAATFRVGHACKDAKSTTGLTVRVPAGFTVQKAEARDGWTLSSSGSEISWKANSPQNAIAGDEKAQFVVRGKLDAKPGPLWFKVLQTCDSGSADWAQIPASDTAKPEFPAARLMVLAPGSAAPVEVSNAWVRRAVPGQSGTGAFMTLKSPAGARLVGASTPVAGVAEVHEMKMEGDTMKMRAVSQGLELPAGQAVELKPGGYHLMLTDLKQAVNVGTTVAITLRFVDAKGVASEQTLQVPVAIGAPDGAASGGEHQHQHKH